MLQLQLGASRNRDVSQDIGYTPIGQRQGMEAAQPIASETCINGALWRKTGDTEIVAEVNQRSSNCIAEGCVSPEAARSTSAPTEAPERYVQQTLVISPLRESPHHHRRPMWLPHPETQIDFQSAVMPPSLCPGLAMKTGHFVTIIISCARTGTPVPPPNRKQGADR